MNIVILLLLHIWGLQEKCVWFFCLYFVGYPTCLFFFALAWTTCCTLSLEWILSKQLSFPKSRSISKVAQKRWWGYYPHRQKCFDSCLDKVALWNLVDKNMNKMSVKAAKCHLKYSIDQGLKLHCSQLKINMPRTDMRDIRLSGHFLFIAISRL